MILAFPHPITRLIDIGIATLRGVNKDEHLKASLEAALAFNAFFISHIDSIRSSGVDKEEIKVLLDKLAAFGNRRTEILQQLELYLTDNNKENMTEAMAEFQQLSVEIQIASMNLTEQSGRTEPQSPFPVIDNFARFARKVTSGIFSPEKLLEKTPLLNQFRETIAREVDFFLSIYPDEKLLAENAKNHLVKFEENAGALNSILKNGKDTEALTREIDNLVLSSKEIFACLEKIASFSKEKAHSSLPLMDVLSHIAVDVIEGKKDLIDFENLFYSFTHSFLHSLIELYTFEDKNIVTTDVVQKYYPFLEEKARVLQDKLEYMINLLKVCMGKELLFREEPQFVPSGFGKFTVLFQFVALGGTNLHPDLYSVDKEIISHQSLFELPLPTYKKPSEELSSMSVKEDPEVIAENQSWKTQKTQPSQNWFPPGIKQSSRQNLLTPTVKQEIKSTPEQVWKPPETKKEPVKKWDSRGYFSSSQSSTENLIDAAINRLKKGN